jgi:hypothetical protein
MFFTEVVRKLAYLTWWLDLGRHYTSWAIGGGLHTSYLTGEHQEYQPTVHSILYN